jgi:hypothetical protein
MKPFLSRLIISRTRLIGYQQILCVRPSIIIHPTRLNVLACLRWLLLTGDDERSVDGVKAEP